MKKFYFFLVAMLLGVITSSAVDYYLIGGFNNWTTKQANCKFTAQGDGTYVLDFKGTLTSGFKINDGTWSNPNANWGGSATLTPGVVYTLTCSGQSGNIPLNDNIQNPHLVFNPTANTLLITGQEVEAEVAYALSGDIFGGSWTDKVMTENNGVWEYPATSFVTGNFGIKKIDAGTSAQLDWISAKGSSVVVPNTPMACQIEGTDFSLTGGSYSVVFDPKAMTVTFKGDTPVVVENTIYWDNSTAAWETVYAYAVNDSNVAFEEKPGTELSDLGNGIWSATIPADYTKVTFSNGEGAEYGAYTIQDEYIYGPDQSGKPYEEPVDYSSWYVNVSGEFNSWGTNGLNPVDGLTTHENLNIGNGEFEINIWDGSANHYFGTATPIELGAWTKIYEGGGHMTIAGAAAGEAFDVEYNCATSEIRVTKAGAIDYTGWYLNICGDFNTWSTDFGKEFNADGTAVNTYENVNTTFKVVVYNGKTDTYYAKDGVLVANQWNDINANQDNMTLPAELQSGKVTFTFNNNTKELKVVADTSAVDAIEIEENVAPVYYNLQGVRVDAPANGLYIVVRGDKVAKEYVK